MNKLNFPLTLVIVITLITGSGSESRAQDKNFVPGYIVTKQRDSIPGLVLLGDHSFNNSKCVYKKSPTDKEVAYSPKDILAYGAGNERYLRSATIEKGSSKKEVFLDCLVLGKLSLFYFEDRLFISSGDSVDELVFMQHTVNRNGTAYHIDQPLYKSTLMARMSDCPSIGDRLGKAKLKQADITEVIGAYHKCINESYTVMKGGSNKLDAHVAIVAGVQFYTMDFYKYGGLRYPASASSSGISFVPSFQVELASSKTFSKLRLVAGISYKSMKNDIHDESLAEINNLIRDLSIEASYLEFPVLIKYHFLNRVQPLFVSAGLGSYFKLHWEDYVRSSSPSGFVYEEKTNQLEANGFNLGFNFSLGWDLPMGNRKTFIEGQYYILPNAVRTTTTSPDVYYRAIVLRAGLRF